jgi:hypothetical protein
MKKLAYSSLPIGLGLLCIASGWSVIAPRWGPVPNKVVLVLGLLLALFGLWSRRSELTAPTGGRRVRAGASAVASGAILVMLVLLINFFAARYHTRWDLTKTKDWSLHPVSERVVKSLTKDVDVYGFFSEAQEPNIVRTVKLQYDTFAYLSPHIKVEVVDPTKRPEAAVKIADKYDVRSSSVTVVICGDRVVSFPGHEEADLTAALREATREANKVIYWTIGHGEREPSQAGGTGAQTLMRSLQREYFVFQDLQLGPTDQVPADAALVIVNDPQRTFPEYEIQAYNRYLEQGGRMLVLTDVDRNQTVGELGPVERLTENWGIVPVRAAIFDPRARTGDTNPTLVIGDDFGERPHESVAGLRGQMMVFPTARPLEYRQVMRDQQVFHHMLVRPQQIGAQRGMTPYVEPDLTRLDDPKVNPEVQRNWIGQPINIAIVAFRRYEPRPGQAEAGVEARLAVIGDADFLTDAHVARQGNTEFALNVVRWLTGEELLIRREKEGQVAQNAMAIEEDARQKLTAVVVGLPLLVALLGMTIWFVRRSK